MSSVDERILKNLDKFQNVRDVVCVWDGCSDDAHPHLEAPLCMNHAKRLTVQVMLLTAKNQKPEKRAEPVKQAAPKLHRLDIPKERQGLVYFIKFADRIKIGFTTDLPTRMKQLPHDQILALIPGAVSTERQLHKKFDDIRITGEWFANDPRLMDYIDTLPKHELLAA